MSCTYQSCIARWVSGILDFEVSVSDIKSGMVLVHLANAMGDIQISPTDLKDSNTFNQFISFLDGCHHFPASKLFSISGILDGTASDEESFGLCLLLLITGLQSQAKQHFIDAATALDVDMQEVIFHLVEEPMILLTADKNLTRECVLNGFNRHISPNFDLDVQLKPLNLSEKIELEDTPIKLVSEERQQSSPSLLCHKPQSGGLSEDAIDRSLIHLGHSWVCKAESNMVCSSPFDIFKMALKAPTPSRLSASHSDEAVFRPPEFVPARRPRPLDRPDQNRDSCITQSPSIPLQSFKAAAACDSLIRPRRPTDLPLQAHTRIDPRRCLSSVATGMVDLSDCHSPSKHQQPLTSPLTCLKDFLDSPLWTQKSRLREVDRERRRLVADLEKERAYRDEVESVVTELRKQLEESRVRVAEAESKSARLSREVAALQDQTDELNICRTDLALREDEIINLKQRLNTLQDKVSGSRKLELENANLRQECADCRQKVEQLTAKLSEIKDRQLVYTEVETLRSKLRDTEAQLAQLLRDGEKAEKFARQQQEQYNQLKLRQNLSDLRRAASKQHSNENALLSSDLGTQLDCTSVEVKEIEFEAPLHGPENIVPASFLNCASTRSSESVSETQLLRSDENLGFVLQNDLHSAHSNVAKLQVDVTTQTDLSRFELPMNLNATESLEHLATDVPLSAPDDEDLTAPCDLSHSALEALTADRRGLSDELVRIHDELQVSNAHVQQLQQENWELHQRLSVMESNLQQRTTLFTRAQESWAIAERKGRELEDRLKSMEAQHASELAAVRAHSLPQTSLSQSETSAINSQIDALRFKHAIERKDLKRQISRLSSELDKVKADRKRLADHNSDLQQQLVNAQRVIIAISQGKSASQNPDGTRCHSASIRRSHQFSPSTNHTTQTNPELPIKSVLESWIEAIGADANLKRLTTNDVCSEVNGEFPLSSDLSSDDGFSGDCNRPSNVPTTQIPGKRVSKRHSFYSEVHNPYANSIPLRASDNFCSHSIQEEIARLTSRNEQIELFASELSQRTKKMCQNNQLPRHSWVQQNSCHQTAHINGLQHSDFSLVRPTDRSLPHSASLDLSTLPHGLLQGQVNPASAPTQLPKPLDSGILQELDTDADSSAYTDLSQVSPVSHCSVRIGTSVNGRQSPQVSTISHPYNAQAFNVSDPAQSCEPHGCHVRSPVSVDHHSLRSGSVQLSTMNSSNHIQSETNEDVIDPERIGELYRRNRLQPPHLRTSYPVETQTVEPSRVADALGHLSLTAQPRKNHMPSLSAVAEEHRSVLHGVVEENIIDSQNASKPAAVLKLVRTVNGNGTNEDGSPLAAGYRCLPKTTQDITNALLSASFDPSVLASALAAKLERASLAVPKIPNDSDSHRHKSVNVSASSTFRNVTESSIAFEIPNEPGNGKSVRRIPAPRGPMFTRPSNGHVLKQRNAIVVKSCCLPATAVAAAPCEKSFQSLETPLQKNPRCLN